MSSGSNPGELIPFLTECGVNIIFFIKTDIYSKTRQNDFAISLKLLSLQVLKNLLEIMSKEKNVQQQVDAEKKKERVSVLEKIRIEEPGCWLGL